MSHGKPRLFRTSHSRDLQALFMTLHMWNMFQCSFCGFCLKWYLAVYMFSAMLCYYRNRHALFVEFLYFYKIMNKLNQTFVLLQMKKELSSNESISQEIVGNAHIENYALKMFLYADNEDRAGHFHK